MHPIWDFILAIPKPSANWLEQWLEHQAARWVLGRLRLGRHKHEWWLSSSMCPPGQVCYSRRNYCKAQSKSLIGKAWRLAIRCSITRCCFWHCQLSGSSCISVITRLPLMPCLMLLKNSYHLKFYLLKGLQRSTVNIPLNAKKYPKYLNIVMF